MVRWDKSLEREQSALETEVEPETDMRFLLSTGSFRVRLVLWPIT